MLFQKLSNFGKPLLARFYLHLLFLLNLNKYFLSQSKTDLSASVAEAIKDSALPKLAASLLPFF
jgi:hypothetical protein